MNDLLHTILDEASRANQVRADEDALDEILGHVTARREWDAAHDEHGVAISSPGRAAAGDAPTVPVAPAGTSKQALCTLCGIPDSEMYPHHANRRVRDGRAYYEYLCSMCLEAEYGPTHDDPYEDER